MLRSESVSLISTNLTQPRLCAAVSLLLPAGSFLYRGSMQPLALLFFASSLLFEKSNKKEQDIKVSYATVAAEAVETQLNDEVLIEICLCWKAGSHLCAYVCVCVWPRRCFFTGIHLLSYWNQHLRHTGTQDGEVGKEITLI